MDGLLSEIKKKKQKQNQLKKELGSDDKQNSKDLKWIRRAELERIREREYWQEMEELKRKRRRINEEKQKYKPKKFEDEEDSEDETEKEIDFNIPRQEVFRRLRVLKEPITLFGESDKDRIRRLRLVEAHAGERVGDEQGSIVQAIRKAEEENREKKLHSESYNNTNNNEESTNDNSSGVDTGYNSDDESYKVTDDMSKEEYVLRTLKWLLHAWEHHMMQLSEEERSTRENRMEAMHCRQTNMDMQSLFKKLENKKLQNDLLVPMHEIAVHIRNKHYVSAHDAYMRLAIGNSPWPMGVTMVGIHERSAREKIEVNKVAHILNDDAQRKYITALKRLMRFAQRKYPDAPSRMVFS
eukprot:gb/GECH01002843.1/.p1 GENE.gb/GECH01002843.1/~~gb/GECH01002843.1/.p1  ORF type:complete len:354 (+),score=122.21 gb/GECH01002843.1/:1-1062(+)